MSAFVALARTGRTEKTESRQNLIAGVPRPSRGAGTFEVRAALPPCELLGSWPVSDEEDVGEALPALRRGALAQARAAPRDQVRRALAAADALAADRELAGALAARLGLRGEEVARHRADLAGSLERALRSGMGAGESKRACPRPGGGGVALVAPHWSELVSGMVLGVTRQFASGRAVLLLADPVAPMCAERVVAALLDAGVEPGAVALLHGAKESAFRAAAEWEDLRALEGSGDRERVALLRRASEGRAVEDVRLRSLRTSAREVALEGDVAVQARTIVAEAFGRARTLSGQLGGSVARVYCPERILSRFTDELLACLEGGEDGRRPVPRADLEGLAVAQEAVRQGLDEGAVLISGGGEGPPELGKRAFVPAVFSNVEPRMRLARSPDPAGVLALLRCR